MEASARLLGSSSPISRRLLSKHSLTSSPVRNPTRKPSPRLLLSPKLQSYPRNVTSPSQLLSLSSPRPRNPPFLSLSSSPRAFASSAHQEPIERIDPQNLDAGNRERFRPPEIDVSDGGGLGFCCGEKGAIWTAVLLGWLGAEDKHLKRYAEIYSAKGIRTVRFVVPVRETVGLDLCMNLEEKIDGLARELVQWCAESEKDGRERHLVFHTFSNTGWIAYGALLQNLQSRNDIIQKIKGCVVDSAPAAELNPQVWAAGYCAALLKKRSSSLVEPVGGGKLDSRSNKMSVQVQISSLMEFLIFKAFEIFFSIALMLPYAKVRLGSIISTLKDQPSYPQLYLYSSADKVIPASLIECFIKEQKALGRDVHAYNFGSSPHVDHFRSFPRVYSAKVNEFLEHCCSKVVSKT